MGCNDIASEPPVLVNDNITAENKTAEESSKFSHNIQVSAGDYIGINADAALTSTSATDGADQVHIQSEPNDTSTQGNGMISAANGTDGSTSQGETLHQDASAVSVAVQCSLSPPPSLSPQQQQQQQATTIIRLEERSTQTEAVVHTDDAAVQVTISAVEEEDTRTLAIEGNISEHPTTTKSAMEVDDKLLEERFSDASFLQQELDSLRNTVLWQALMLRLHEMH